MILSGFLELVAFCILGIAVPGIRHLSGKPFTVTAVGGFIFCLV